MLKTVMTATLAAHTPVQKPPGIFPKSVMGAGVSCRCPPCKSSCCRIDVCNSYICISDMQFFYCISKICKSFMFSPLVAKTESPQRGLCSPGRTPERAFRLMSRVSQCLQHCIDLVKRFLYCLLCGGGDRAAVSSDVYVVSAFA